MRIKEIATILGAGILSLAAVMILESEPPPLTVASETAPATGFEDTTSLIEYAPPAPTAEPPASADKEDAEPEELFVSVGGSDPVPAPVDAEGKPLPSDFTEPAPEASGIDETPVETPSEGAPEYTPAGAPTTAPVAAQ